jgi:hemin uptake protein HemP
MESRKEHGVRAVEREAIVEHDGQEYRLRTTATTAS